MIYTIGSSNRSEDEFFGPLKARDIRTLVDVRSSPNSRMPLFTKAALVRACMRHGIDYVYGGRVLGGLNEILSTDKLFREKLDAVYKIETDRGNVAMMCAEGDPKDCHRSYKVGLSMRAYDGVVVTNILRDGVTEQDVEISARRAKRDYVDDLAFKKLFGMSA